MKSQLLDTKLQFWTMMSQELLDTKLQLQTMKLQLLRYKVTIMNN